MEKQFNPYKDYLGLTKVVKGENRQEEKSQCEDFIKCASDQDSLSVYRDEPGNLNTVPPRRGPSSFELEDGGRGQPSSHEILFMHRIMFGEQSHRFNQDSSYFTPSMTRETSVPYISGQDKSLHRHQLTQNSSFSRWRNQGESAKELHRDHKEGLTNQRDPHQSHRFHQSHHGGTSNWDQNKQREERKFPRKFKCDQQFTITRGDHYIIEKCKKHEQEQKQDSESLRHYYDYPIVHSDYIRSADSMYEHEQKRKEAVNLEATRHRFSRAGGQCVFPAIPTDSVCHSDLGHYVLGRERKNEDLTQQDIFRRGIPTLVQRQESFRNDGLKEGFLPFSSQLIETPAMLSSDPMLSNPPTSLYYKDHSVDKLCRLMRKGKLLGTNTGTDSDRKVCNFCKTNGETKKFYRSHELKDNTGKVVCPILRTFRCPICKATGDYAHTVTYCPFGTGMCSSMVTSKTHHMSSGRPRSYRQ